MVHGFVCSKPFQFVNILNLPYDFYNTGVQRILIILNHFPGAEMAAEKIPPTYPFWDKIYLVQERDELNELLKNHKISTLYTDIDTGKVPFTWSLIVKEMNVYEEGTQNYRSIRADYIKYPITTKLRQVITPLLGWGSHLGSNRKTKNIYVYNPAYFTSNIKFLLPKVKRLSSDLYSFLEENFAKLNNIFPVPKIIENIQNEHVAIYITSHSVNDKILERLQTDVFIFNRVLVKVHPHILYQQPALMDKLQDLPFEIITENLLAEMMFITLLKNGNKLSIFHESSTACLYLQEDENVKIFEYREGEYRNFYKKLRDCYLATAANLNLNQVEKNA